MVNSRANELSANFKYTTFGFWASCNRHAP